MEVRGRHRQWQVVAEPPQTFTGSLGGGGAFIAQPSLYPPGSTSVLGTLGSNPGFGPDRCVRSEARYLWQLVFYLSQEGNLRPREVRWGWGSSSRILPVPAFVEAIDRNRALKVAEGVAQWIKHWTCEHEVPAQHRYQSDTLSLPPPSVFKK